MGRVWRTNEGLRTLSLYRRDIHHTIMRSRRIQQDELAAELGVTKQAVHHYLARGGSEEVAERIDDALTRISDRRGLNPERAVWPISGLCPDGLPDTYVTPMAGYLDELRLRDLMAAPGRDL